MKKIAALLSILVIFATSAFAEIHPRYRKVEFGFDGQFSMAQNLFSINDIFTETIKLDFPKMYDTLGGKDFSVRTNNDLNLSLNVDVGLISVGLEWDALNIGGNFTISNDIFKLLSEGNVLDEKMKFSMGMGLDMFSTFAVPVGVDLGKIAFTVKPSLFIPLLHIPNPDAGVEYYADSQSGNMTAKLFMHPTIYTVFNPNVVMDKNLENVDISRIISDYGKYFSFVGFDISGSAEYELSDTLDVGGYLNMPIVPGRLDYSISFSAEKDLEVPSISDFLLPKEDDSSSEEPEPQPPEDGGFDLGEVVFGTGKSYKINRPLRIGAEASWRPFGNWIALRPALGIAFRNPFGKDFGKGDFYVEYALNVDMRVLYVFCFNLTSAYLEQNFVQELGIGFNFRVMEIDFNIASSSPSFAKSFGLGGVLAKLSVKTGF